MIFEVVIFNNPSYKCIGCTMTLLELLNLQSQYSQYPFARLMIQNNIFAGGLGEQEQIKFLGEPTSKKWWMGSVRGSGTYHVSQSYGLDASSYFHLPQINQLCTTPFAQVLWKQYYNSLKV